MINSIIAAIQELIRKFLPFRMVKETEFGIRWTAGKFGRIVQGKFLWCIPLLQEVEVLDATIAGFFPPVQCVSTSDSRAIAIRIGLEWKITDVRAFVILAGENDADEILSVMVQSAIASAVSKVPIEELISRQRPVETHITNQISRMTQEYGIFIKRAHIVECVPVFPIRVYRGSNARYISNPE